MRKERAALLDCFFYPNSYYKSYFWCYRDGVKVVDAFSDFIRE